MAIRLSVTTRCSRYTQAQVSISQIRPPRRRATAPLLPLSLLLRALY